MTTLIAIGAGIAVLTGIGSGIGIGIATSKACLLYTSRLWSWSCHWVLQKSCPLWRGFPHWRKRKGTGHI